MQEVPLRTSLRPDGTTLFATLAGTAESSFEAALATFIGQVRSEAARLNATNVVADLRELEFATSSCLKVIAMWLVDVAENARYRVEFRSNPAYSWQRRSLRALVTVAPDLVEIVE